MGLCRPLSLSSALGRREGGEDNRWSCQTLPCLDFQIPSLVALGVLGHPKKLKWELYSSRVIRSCIKSLSTYCVPRGAPRTQCTTRIRSLPCGVDLPAGNQRKYTG